MKTRAHSSNHPHRTDGAALLLRLTIGPMLVAHGYNKVFGPGGIEGTTRWFDSLGLQPAKVHARLAAATEIGAGSLMTIGAASPLPSAAVIGLMTTAARTDHKGKGLFIFKGGWEYTAVIGAVAVAMAAIGPGRYSLDGIRRRQRRGPFWTLAAIVFGIAGSTALLATSYRPDPPAEALATESARSEPTSNTGAEPATA